MLYLPAYTHKRRLYLASLYPTSFTLDSIFALTICAQRKTNGWCSTPALWLVGIFLCKKKIYAGIVGTRTDWVLKAEKGGMTTTLLRYVARFDGGDEIIGFV